MSLGGEREFEPDRVGVEVAERELVQAAVLGGADAVLDPCAGAVAALEGGDVGAGLVGEDRLEAVAVVVAEGQLRAGMRTLATDDHSRALGAAGALEPVSELGDLSVLARLAVGVQRRGPRRL